METIEEIGDELMAERRRQIEEEGWSREHDDRHGDGSLAKAAAAYALLAGERPNLVGEHPRMPRATRFFETVEYLWPWTDAPMKGNRRRALVKAGALIIAEIERLDRTQTEERPDG